MVPPRSVRALSTSKPRAVVALLLLVCGLAIAVRAQPAAPADTQRTRVDNYYGAGDHVQIASPMEGDVIVAGREVDITQPVAGDIIAAGWRVSVVSRAGDDVRIAAGTVAIDAPVTGDLTVAGGDVTLGPQVRVGGRSWVTGRNVRIEGILDRDLHVAGAAVTIAGEIRKPVEVIAEKLEILPSARILETLTYKGSTAPHIAHGAVVNGPIAYEQIPEPEARRAWAFPGISTMLFSIHVFLAGLVFVMFLPRVETSLVETLRARPGRSLLAGALLFVTIPLAAVLLIMSVLGLPIGLALAALYAVALFVGVTAMAFFVGDTEVRLMNITPVTTRTQHVVALLAGVLTLALGRAFLGGLVVFVSVLFGVGALTLAAWQVYSRQQSNVGAVS
jgi:cytoskeletal protein CcmA (bactofilin family)